MTMKSAAKSFGSGLLTVTVAVANSTTRTRIYEIERDVEALQRQIDELNAEKSNLESNLIVR